MREINQVVRGSKTLHILDYAIKSMSYMLLDSGDCDGRRASADNRLHTADASFGTEIFARPPSPLLIINAAIRFRYKARRAERLNFGRT